MGFENSFFAAGCVDLQKVSSNAAVGKIPAVHSAHQCPATSLGTRNDQMQVMAKPELQKVRQGLISPPRFAVEVSLMIRTCGLDVPYNEGFLKAFNITVRRARPLHYGE